ncbi:MAG TPA: dihydroorotate dehydrogenase-like protein [Thermoanaerobaculales bacterium]|nr:dihydroorotate dehydrogenase-like protein [Thermoanaerobaculales bacterium]HPA81844.1 dihydroorotate dehydrogenase-like protein [Thermoanaerobaculales bacterium]HQN97676.1 dihydroorotate dehydrogenase-like protein [Thermoanaerobaculales bacterium]HQP44893.1 dihydroorotate dehydrogenase-like protein [Thermoanaerobaculales bacterium]
MDLTTTYLGFELANPIMVGSCPLGTNVDSVRRLQEAGAAAIVLPSLFEEEILAAARAHLAMESAGAGFAEASSYLPDPEGYHVGPEEYLGHIEAVKAATSIPVMASLNGTTAGGWTSYAKKIEDAGADALELNVYYLPTEVKETGEDVERRTVEIVQAVKADVSIPVAVKLSPFFSSIPNLGQRLQGAGADGLVIFNRFYQPDIDIEDLDVVPNLRLSTTDELRLRLRWLAILSGQLDLSLAATGGAHTAVDVIKAVMAGAHAVQLVSALLIHGPEHISRTLEAISFWMQEHEYHSVRQMQGSMNLAHTPNPKAFARANYMKMLDSWEL